MAPAYSPLVKSRDARSRSPKKRGHVRRARRVLAHDRRRAGADVSQARQPPLRLVVQRVRRPRRIRRGHRILAPAAARRVAVRFAPDPRSLRLPGIAIQIVGLDFARQDRLAPPLDGHDLRLPAVLEKRLHGLAEHDLGFGAAQAVLRAEPCQSRMVWKTRRVLTGVSLAPGATPGHHHQRHVHRRLIEQVAVLRLAVIAEPLAVIGDDDDRRRTGRSSRTPGRRGRSARPWPRPRRGTARSA